MTFSITADQEVALAAVYYDDHGNVATPSGSAQWETTDDTIITLLDTDNHHATAVAAGPVGAIQVRLTLGTKSGFLNLLVTAGDAAAIVFTTPGPRQNLSLIWLEDDTAAFDLEDRSGHLVF